MYIYAHKQKKKKLEGKTEEQREGGREGLGGGG